MQAFATPHATAEVPCRQRPTSDNRPGDDDGARHGKVRKCKLADDEGRPPWRVSSRWGVSRAHRRGLSDASLYEQLGADLGSNDPRRVFLAAQLVLSRGFGEAVEDLCRQLNQVRQKAAAQGVMVPPRPAPPLPAGKPRAPAGRSARLALAKKLYVEHGMFVYQIATAVGMTCQACCRAAEGRGERPAPRRHRPDPDGGRAGRQDRGRVRRRGLDEGPGQDARYIRAGGPPHPRRQEDHGADGGRADPRGRGEGLGGEGRGPAGGRSGRGGRREARPVPRPPASAVAIAGAAGTGAGVNHPATFFGDCTNCNNPTRAAHTTPALFTDRRAKDVKLSLAERLVF